MRICLLSYRGYKFSGGQGIYVRYLSRSLLKLGHEVDVVAGPPYPDLVEGINLVKLPSLDLYTLPEYRRFVINPSRLNTWPNLVEWLGECAGVFTEPHTFGMRAYDMFRHNGHQRKYDIVHDNQCLSYGIWAISRKIPTIATIHHPITIDRDISISTLTSLWKKAKQKRWYSFIGMQKRV